MSGYMVVDTGAQGGGGVLTINDGASITLGGTGIVQIGRQNEATAHTTSKLVFNGGSFTNNATGSGTRI